MEKVYDIRDYGAVGDGIFNCTEALQKAIDECSANGGGTVLVASGKYLFYPLRLKNDVRLEIAWDAVLLAGTNDFNGGTPLGEWWTIVEEEVNSHGKMMKKPRRVFQIAGHNQKRLTHDENAENAHSSWQNHSYKRIEKPEVPNGDKVHDHIGLARQHEGREHNSKNDVSAREVHACQRICRH